MTGLPTGVTGVRSGPRTSGAEKDFSPQEVRSANHICQEEPAGGTVMSGTTTVDPVTGVTLRAEEEPQQRRSKRLLGLEQTIPLDKLNIPTQGPPLLISERGRNNLPSNTAPGKPKGSVRFGEVGSFLMRPFSTTRARSNSAGSVRAEGRGQGAPVGSLSDQGGFGGAKLKSCLLYTSPSPRDGLLSRMPSSA